MDQLLVETNERVLTLTMNRPERLNPLSPELVRGLSDAIREADRSPDIRAIVLTGAGRGFSSGADMANLQARDATTDTGDLLRTGLNPLIARLRALEKPVLAALNGVAAGAGVSLALACDLRFAAESARLVLAFVRIGLVPDAGSTFFLPRLLGPAKTLELAWTGDPIGAQEAYELGLINKVLPDERVLGHTQELAARLAAGPAVAQALIKRAINQAHELPLERILDLEADYQTIASRQPDFKEGVAAFLEKRPARFQ